MNKSVIVQSILKTDTTPIIVNVGVLKGCCIVIDVDEFTPQMFYELPIIRIEVYQNDYKIFSKLVRTYNPISNNSLIVIDLPDIYNTLDNLYISITPIFDNNSINARNELIKKCIEIGELWESNTLYFPITMELIS